MTIEPPYYSTLVLFGKEHERTVASPVLFQELVSTLGTFLQIAGCPLRCRGFIEGIRGRNIAPRRGALNKKKVENWKDHLTNGRFNQFEIFDAWSDDVFPTVYAAINKLCILSIKQGKSERVEVYRLGRRASRAEGVG